MSRSLSLVIPCFNEEASIVELIESTRQAIEKLRSEHGFTDVEIIVVDDASIDQSRQKLSLFSDVRVISNQRNLGYGASLKRGFQAARNDLICFFDMDLTYPISELPRLIEKFDQENADMVIGARPLQSEGMSLVRGLGNWFFTKLSRFFFGAEISDVCSGYRLFRRSLLPDIMNFSENGLSFSLEMSIAFTKMKYRIHEVQINYLPRAGQSKLSVVTDGFQFLFLIFRHFLTASLKVTTRL